MDDESVLDDLEDVATDIMNLIARVIALQKNLEKSLGVIDELFDGHEL